jgi:membrane protein YdbS with pleckstrin-like domain
MNTVERHAAHPVPPSEANGAPERRQDPARDAGLPTRPDHNLLVYYALQSLLLGPFFWAMLIPYYFRYRSLRYEFDAEGVGMSWGILFRKEISLTYARIQDIHLNSNVVERWLGLARIQVQTASGSAGAEMTIEGLPDFERIRDMLYVRMRGARNLAPISTNGALAAEASLPPPAATDDLAITMREVAAELRAVRLALEARAGGGDA